ncbi:MAG: hypothetical protein AB8B73_00970 [Ekhidna sp.]
MERIEQLLDFSKSWAWLNYALLPMIYLLKFTFITIWLLSGSILFGYKTSFKQIFHIVILAEFVWLIPSVLSLRDTEKFVISLLQKIKQDVAVLMVTHRLQTALESDMIYLLEKAEIVDAGDSKSLLERDNFLSRNYQELMQQ